MIGEVYGGYTILSRVGAGGMGEVYLGEHSRILRRAAIKVLRTEYSSNGDTLERFFNEAKTTSAISHPNIVEILDCDVHPRSGRAFIVMELLEGESLRDFLSRVGALAGQPALVGAIVTQVAMGLEMAHQRGIVHRDLKPDNVFLSASRGEVTVKILDFGIAKLLNQDTSSGSRTQTGMIMGSPLYMSPEQCRGEKVIDARSDIYSLGCMLFEMLCGRPPFCEEFAGALLAAHMMTPPPSPSSIVSHVPRELEELTMRMLAKDPAARPRALSEILHAFQAFPPAPIPVEVKPVPTGTMALTPESSMASGARRSAPAPFVSDRSALNPSTLNRNAISIDHVEAGEPRRRSRAVVLVPVVGAVSLAMTGAVFVALRDRNPATPTMIASAPPVVASAAADSVLPERPASPSETAEVSDAPEVLAVDKEILRSSTVIRSRPLGADVFVDGETAPRGVTPFELSTSEEHALTLRLPGRKEKRISVRRGEIAVVAVDLDPTPLPAPAQRGPAKTKSPKSAAGYKALDD